MSRQLENVYKVQPEDIRQAGITLATAFQHDAEWKLLFKTEAPLEQKARFFESPVKYCLKYGGVFATSKRLEGVAAWTPGHRADMTIWRLIRSGAILSSIKALSAFTKLARKQAQIFKPLEEDRKANMQGRDYIYLFVLGVATKFQGQGFGSTLVKALIEKSEQAELPLYTETQTERNVRFYERLGFRQIRQITLPIIDLPQWELIREPST